MAERTRGDELAQLIFESVADDERLRGELDDEAYGPLLEWAAVRASQLGAAASEDRLDALSHALRAAVGQLVAAVASGDASRIEAIDQTILSPGQRDQATASLRAAASSQGARSRAVVESLMEADR